MDNKNILDELSKTLKFNVNKEVKEDIKNLYDDLIKDITHMQTINTDKVKPMVRICDEPITFLREDIVKPGLDKEIILSNAPHTEGDFIVINKRNSND